MNDRSQSFYLWSQRIALSLMILFIIITILLINFLPKHNELEGSRDEHCYWAGSPIYSVYCGENTIFNGFEKYPLNFLYVITFIPFAIIISIGNPVLIAPLIIFYYLAFSHLINIIFHKVFKMRRILHGDFSLKLQKRFFIGLIAISLPLQVLVSVHKEYRSLTYFSAKTGWIDHFDSSHQEASLYLAMSRKELEVVEALYEQKIPRHKARILSGAISRSNKEIVEFILNQGISITPDHQRDAVGRALNHKRCEEDPERIEILKVILDRSDYLKEGLPTLASGIVCYPVMKLILEKASNLGILIEDTEKLKESIRNAKPGSYDSLSKEPAEKIAAYKARLIALIDSYDTKNN